MLQPTGTCWCGCGADTRRGSFFLPGHDRVAESAVITLKYGGVPELLEHHGFGPGGRNVRQAIEEWRAKGGRVR